MLSNQSKYAVRAVLYLAVNSSKDHKLGSKEIADLIDVPGPFLAKIFQNLSKSKIILSAKGPNGGFYMTEKELSNNILNIIASIDGLDFFNNCLVGMPTCSDENPCAIHHLAGTCKNNLMKALKERSVSDFVNGSKDGISFNFLK